MASTCPNCGKKLHLYDIKAECKHCGVSIPNFNWEARLEEDNIKAEKKFQSFYRTLNSFAYSIWGTRLRIVRIVLSFLPAIGFILPWAYVKSEAQSIGIDMIGIFTSGKSLIDILSSFFSNTGLYFMNMSYEGYSGPVTYTMLSILFMLISIILMVVAFFLILFTFKKPKTKAMFAIDILSIASAVISAVLFSVGMSTTSSFTGYNFGDIPMYNANGSVSWGLFVALALFVIAAIANLLVSRADAKSDEQLEKERLERKAANDEKERQAKIQKEKAREEAEKKAAEEQAALVEEARARLNAEKNK